MSILDFDVSELFNLSLLDQGHCAQYLEKTLQQGANDVSLYDSWAPKRSPKYKHE